METAKDARLSAPVDGVSSRRREGTGCHFVLGRRRISGMWLDRVSAQDPAVDLPIVTHPVGGAKPPFYPGLPLKRRSGFAAKSKTSSVGR